jgi:intracellular septation protein
MQFLADYFPLILFFVAFKLWGIYTATGVAIVASVAQIVYFRLHRGKVSGVHWLSFGVIVVFGGATLLLHDDTFIKWKPTVLYWALAAALVIARLFFRKNLMSALLKDMTLPDSVWGRVTWGWAAFLAAMGAVNLYVANNFPTDTWVNFKVWGSMVIFMLAGVGTVISVARHLPEES